MTTMYLNIRKQSALMKDIHGGNVSKLYKKLGLSHIPEIQYDFSVNLNPLGPPASLSNLMNSMRNIDWQNYPDTACLEPAKNLAEAHKIKPEFVTLGNGATELFSIILNAFNIKSADYLSPCYSGYKEVCKKTRVDCFPIKNLDEINSDAVFIGYPNNPTGDLINRHNLLNLVHSNKTKLFIVDESFMDFVIDSESRTLISLNIPKNLIVVKSLTKIFNIAGIRLGIAVSKNKNIEKMNQFRLPWSVNAIAQKAATILYSDKHFIEKTQTEIRKLREELSERLSTIRGIKIFPSMTNFILFQSDNFELQQKLLSKKIFIRSCENIEGLGPGYYRIAVKNKDTNDILADAINLITTPA